jgi:bifunctional oligoribonuclease and PAP phosphatase NrnA
MNDSFEKIADALRSATRIGVACHVRPDGDAIGSIVAFGQSMKLAGKEVFFLSEDVVPANLGFLPGSDLVMQSSPLPLALDVAVALDTATKARLGDNTNIAFSDAALLVNMDHHGTNPRYGHLNHIDTHSPATGEIVYEFLTSQGFTLDDTVRQNLFCAISTDTGSFQYSSTTARTHRIVAEMIEAGVDTADLAQKLYQTQPLRRISLMKAMLNDMKFSVGGKLASWALSQQTQKEVGMQSGDTEDLIDTLRTIEGVISAVMFEELPDGKVRISSRSKDARLDVSKVCSLFGGGGHAMAAGARLAGPLSEAEARFLEALKNEIERID